MKCELADICYYYKEKIEVSLLDDTNYISTENMLPNKAGIIRANSLPSSKTTQKYEKDDILVSNIRPYFKKIWKASFDGGCSNDVLVFRAKENISSDFLYYLLSNDEFFEYSMSTSKGTKMPRGDKEAIMRYKVPILELEEQEKVASLLSALDEKIALNQKISNNLEQQAQTIFKSWFVDFQPFKDEDFDESELGEIPKDWKISNLTNIAEYLNGLAMQKFRPLDGEKGIPVMKIKELRQGCCDNSSELCSPNIKNEYIIHDGDVIFSWSGSLLVDIWCGGTCGLNQHLFKVSSNKYDKWFYYMWTKYHLNRFIAIASDKATTMGHIKREELNKAKVLIPSKADYSKINSILKPIFEMIILNRIENQRLIMIRDHLIPKLMTGEIQIPLEV